MKKGFWFVFAAGLAAAGGAFAESPAYPVEDVSATLYCEQGNVRSYKVCGVSPEGYARYVWTVNSGAVLDPGTCHEGSTVCTVYCVRGRRDGTVYVSIHDAAGTLVAQRSRTLGCAS